MSGDTAAFSAVLRQLRTSAALSQEALAERAGLSPRGISDLERGVRRAPHLATVRLLAETAAPARSTERQLLLAAAHPGGFQRRTTALAVTMRRSHFLSPRFSGESRSLPTCRHW